MKTEDYSDSRNDGLPFKSGSLYPLVWENKRGYYESDWCDGEFIENMTYFKPIGEMSREFTDRIKWTLLYDPCILEDGQVWANDDRTEFAVYY